jgi:hypothetical protein
MEMDRGRLRSGDVVINRHVGVAIDSLAALGATPHAAIRQAEGHSVQNVLCATIAVVYMPKQVYRSA